MKRFGLLAVTGLVYFYCSGYLYSLGYFGSITNSVGWLTIPKDEYIAMGFFAISDHLVLTTFFLLLMGVLLLSCGDETISLLYNKKTFNKRKVEKVALKTICTTGVACFLLLLIIHSALRTMHNGGKAFVKDLSDNRVDEVCLIGGECLTGKLMKDTGHSYIIYLGTLEAGRLEIIPHTKVSGIILGWSKESHDRILKYAEKIQ